MSDLISRQDAIDALNELNCFGYVEEAFEQLAEKIMSVPSAERKKGFWIEDARTWYEALNEHGFFVDQHTPYFTDDIACSECLKKFNVIDNETQNFKFCPNCGAEMRGEENDS